MKRALIVLISCLALTLSTQAKDKKKREATGSFTAMAYLLVPGSNTTYFNTPGQAQTMTNCYGTGTDLGYLINMNVNCQSNTVITPSQSYPMTIRYTDVYNLVETKENRIVLGCRGIWRWTKCVPLRVGDIFSYRDLGGQFEVGLVTQKGKPVYSKYQVFSVTAKEKR